MSLPSPRFFVSCALSKWIRYERTMRDAGPLAIELALRGNDLDELPPAALRRFRAYLDETGLPCLVHAPFVDLNPGSADRAVREAALARHGAAMDLSAELGAAHVVFHTGYRPDPASGRERSFWSWAAETFAALAARAPRGELPFILLENTRETTPDPLVKLRDAVGSRAGFCLDPGHANVVSELPLGDWVDAFAPHLVELHLHDNHGQRDEHLPCGEGTVDWTALSTRPRPPSCWSFTAEHASPEHVEATRRWLATHETWLDAPTDEVNG